MLFRAFCAICKSLQYSNTAVSSAELPWDHLSITLECLLLLSLRFCRWHCFFFFWPNTAAASALLANFSILLSLFIQQKMETKKSSLPVHSICGCLEHEFYGVQIENIIQMAKIEGFSTHLYTWCWWRCFFKLYCTVCEYPLLLFLPLPVSLTLPAASTVMRVALTLRWRVGGRGQTERATRGMEGAREEKSVWETKT